MTETMLVETNKVTAHVTVKIPGDVPYSSVEAGVFIPILLAPDASEDDTAATANAALAIGMRAAADALGIPHTETTTDTGDVVVTLGMAETVKAAAPAKPAAKPSSGGFVDRNKPSNKPRQSSGGGGGRTPTRTESGAVVVLNAHDDDIPEWLSDTFMNLVNAGTVDLTDNEVWDNRRFSPQFGGNGKDNAPWFKTTEGQVVLDWGGEPVEVK